MYSISTHTHELMEAFYERDSCTGVPRIRVLYSLYLSRYMLDRKTYVAPSFPKMSIALTTIYLSYSRRPLSKTLQYTSSFLFTQNFLGLTFNRVQNYDYIPRERTKKLGYSLFLVRYLKLKSALISKSPSFLISRGECRSQTDFEKANRRD